MDLVGRRGGRATAARRRLFEFVVAGGFAYGFGASVKPRRWAWISERGSVVDDFGGGGCTWLGGVQKNLRRSLMLSSLGRFIDGFRRSKPGSSFHLCSRESWLECGCRLGGGLEMEERLSVASDRVLTHWV